MGSVHFTLFYSNITIFYSNITFFYSNPYVYVLRNSNFLMGKIDNSMVWDRFTIILFNYTNRFLCVQLFKVMIS